MPDKPQYIIAIGASAGGLDEINLFFDYTPLDSVSYIIVQHLSPDFKSRMVEVIARHSKLTVEEAEEGMAVARNKVYLIPNNKFMTISNNCLYLTAKKGERGPHLTINRFFNSLAINSGKNAIGVILSGLGSDGTEGTKAIKKAGGMVVARTPETTEFGSMPSNAIATGLVDFILEPEAMPAAIEGYVKQESKTLLETNGDTRNVEVIVNLIKEVLPLDFSEYKQNTILRRIKRRAEANHFSRLDQYTEFLKATPGEMETLAQDFLISVTTFFRDKEAFELLQNKVIPDILQQLDPDEEIKLWIAGCATGEEAYSLAILIAEQLTAAAKDNIVKIFATDIDDVALATAAKGIYPQAITSFVSPQRLERYFLPEGDGYRIKPGIRKMVIFAHHDLIKNPPYCNMHFIGCRNVLIYMTPVLQKKVLSMLLFGIKKDGYFFLGSSENPLHIMGNLEVIDKKWRIYKNLENKKFVSFDVFSLPVMLNKKQANTLFSRSDTPPLLNNTVAEALNANLVSELDYLAICVDEKNNVVKCYGDTTRYLLQKNFNSNLVELLPRPLAIAYNTLSMEASTTNKKASLKGIKIKHENGVISVNLSITNLNVNNGLQKLMLVTLNENKTAITPQSEMVTFDEESYFNQYVQNLEKQVKELKEKLDAAYLQLDASNENMQSFNEELLSANEEMQSTNEEMQSVNEELHTINADYQLKNKELAEVNDDLNNYFRSNINGQLFVNKDIQLMKFSPGTVKQINLVPGDIGRPLSNISTNIKFETILEDIKKVITNETVITKEVETDNGKWYQVMTMPYVQLADKKNNGAIITFNDITELKKVQRELDKKNESLLRINADLENFVNTASHDLIGPLGNIELSIEMVNTFKVTDPKLNTLLNVINTSVKKFRGLINDISAIAKIESDMMVLELVDIDEILTNVEWSLENKIKASGAVIIRNLKVKHILFSKKNMRSIIYNLVSNGIKFKSDLPPVITISTANEADQVILTVEDNGIGMNNTDLAKIFALYGRLHNNVEGQGIGLYLAKKIVDASGGNIMVQSELGKGTIFSIFLKPGIQQNPVMASENNLILTAQA